MKALEADPLKEAHSIDRQDSSKMSNQLEELKANKSLEQVVSTHSSTLLGGDRIVTLSKRLREEKSLMM